MNSGDETELLAGLQPIKPLSELFDPRAALCVVKGNLWDFLPTHKLVITTNIGWDPVSKQNNMGAGTAYQAATKWPGLPLWYGKLCASTAPSTPVLEHPDLPLIFFPVKPLLDADDPEISWNQKAQLDLIAKSARQLALIEGQIALTFPGCGNGGLDPSAVYPILCRALDPDRFLIVDSRDL